MGEKFISAKLDIVFKKLFAENEDILKEFLSDILDIPIEKIKGITVLNPDILPESIGEKATVLTCFLMWTEGLST